MLRKICVIAIALAVGLTFSPQSVTAQSAGSRDVVFLPFVSAPSTVETDTPDVEVIGNAQTVCALALGEAGIHYAGQGQDEMLPWGPSALAVGRDGSYWIADGAANRVLVFDAACELANVLTLDGITVGIADVAPAGDVVWVLDVSAQPAALVRLGNDGVEQARLALSADVAAQATGIALGDGDVPLLELQGGHGYLRVGQDDMATAAAVDALARQGQAYRAHVMGTPAQGAQRAQVALGGVTVTVDVPNIMGGIQILGVADDARAFVTVDELAGGVTLQVDETVRMFAADGTDLGRARVPLAEQHVYVPNSLALGPAGELYFLATRPAGVEIQRLSFAADLPARLSVPAVDDAGLDDMARGDEQALFGTDVDAVAVDSPACVTRATILAEAQRFVNNETKLSKSNISGKCDGRTKPRYLKKPGTYTSVPYDWGGFVSVDEFNALMAQGKQAGDIQSPGVEACSVGVDCSGFVSSVWQLTSKRSTRTLPDISTPLAAVGALQDGDILNKESVHTVIFAGFVENGINIYESTRSQSVDRVRFTFRSWSSLDGYTPYRYNGICE